MCLYNIQDFSDCLETSIKQNKNDLSKNDEANPEKMFPLAQLKNLVGKNILTQLKFMMLEVVLKTNLRS